MKIEKKPLNEVHNHRKILLTIAQGYIIITQGIIIFRLPVSFVLCFGGREISMSNSTRVRKNESLEDALRRFKRSVSKSGTLSEYRKREYYEKPSVRRKKKSEAARKQAARKRK